MKSGYKLLCEDSLRGEASSSNFAANMVFWFGIWKLKMPRELKHFLWRACTNSLPTKVNLMKRKVLVDPLCHYCGKQPEDIMHALWGCESIKHVWCDEFSWVNEFEASQGLFADLIGHYLQKPRVRKLFATTAWFLWTHRNKTRLNESTLPSSNINAYRHCILHPLINFGPWPQWWVWHMSTKGNYRVYNNLEAITTQKCSNHFENDVEKWPLFWS